MGLAAVRAGNCVATLVLLASCAQVPAVGRVVATLPPQTVPSPTLTSASPATRTPAPATPAPTPSPTPTLSFGPNILGFDTAWVARPRYSNTHLAFTAESGGFVLRSDSPDWDCAHTGVPYSRAFEVSVNLSIDTSSSAFTWAMVRVNGRSDTSVSVWYSLFRRQWSAQTPRGAFAIDAGPVLPRGATTAATIRRTASRTSVLLDGNPVLSVDDQEDFQSYDLALCAYRDRDDSSDATVHFGAVSFRRAV